MIPIIGLEIHLQLNTKSKVFCGCSTNIWKAEPNTHTCPVCLGLPGALPVINHSAVEGAILAGLALNCKINRATYFERKNYFYPDLPKGYQISQKRVPLGRDGFIEVGGGRVDIWEIHLEEDTAKSLHKGNRHNDATVKSQTLDRERGETLLDFNKSGIPLLEIVSAPCIHSVELLDAYAKEVREIARALKISNGDMEKGQMRFEANVSIAKSKVKSQKSNLPDYRAEIKNLNSFKSLRDSVAYEIERQTKALEDGKILVQETRGWDARKGQTFVQRKKEAAHDYRYFPEPDLPPLEITNELIGRLRAKLPELPSQMKKRLVSLGLTPSLGATIAQDPRRLQFFERLVELDVPPKEAANLVVNRPEIMEQSPEEILRDFRRKEEEKVSDVGELEEIAKKVIKENPQPVSDYQSGKEEALQFLIGQMMKKTRGKADPRVAQKVLKKFLSL